MEPGLERWAYGALWAALAGSLALRAARRALGPGRGLVLPLALLAGLQSLCRACLPLPLGLALAAAAACLLLWRASPRRLLPVAGRAVLVTGECGDSGLEAPTAPAWGQRGAGAAQVLREGARLAAVPRPERWPARPSSVSKPNRPGRTCCRPRPEARSREGVASAPAKAAPCASSARRGAMPGAASSESRKTGWDMWWGWRRAGAPVWEHLGWPKGCLLLPSGPTLVLRKLLVASLEATTGPATAG